MLKRIGNARFVQNKVIDDDGSIVTLGEIQLSNEQATSGARLTNLVKAFSDKPHVETRTKVATIKTDKVNSVLVQDVEGKSIAEQMTAYLSAKLEAERKFLENV